MGKGDKKTKKGKITKGTFGVRRPKKVKKTIITAKKTKATPAKAKAPAKKKAATPKAKATKATKTEKAEKEE